MRIRWRLPLAFALATLIFAGIVALVAAVALRGVFLDRLEDEMLRQAHQYAATIVAFGDSSDPAGADVGLTALQSLTNRVGTATDARFTVIDHEGVVLADSQADPATLDNHRSRPEVARALAGQEAKERRYSATLGQEEVYAAVPLPARAVRRGRREWSASLSRPDVRTSMVAASWRIPLIVWAVLLLPMLLAAYLLTRSIVKPLERLRHMTAQVASGDFAHRTSVHRKDELGELADSLNSMAAQLDTRDDLLRAEMERSSQVLAAMTEGVLVADADGRLI